MGADNVLVLRWGFLDRIYGIAGLCGIGWRQAERPGEDVEKRSRIAAVDLVDAPSPLPRESDYPYV